MKTNSLRFAKEQQGLIAGVGNACCPIIQNPSLSPRHARKTSGEQGYQLISPSAGGAASGAPRVSCLRFALLPSRSPAIIVQNNGDDDNGYSNGSNSNSNFSVDNGNENNSN